MFQPVLMMKMEVLTICKSSYGMPSGDGGICVSNVQNHSVYTVGGVIDLHTSNYGTFVKESEMEEGYVYIWTIQNSLVKHS